jgi:hypothetical protein
LGKEGYHDLCGQAGSNMDKIEPMSEGWHAANAAGSVEEEPVVEEQVTEEDMNAWCSIKGPEPVDKGNSRSSGRTTTLLVVTGLGQLVNRVLSFLS